jgi:hypothetical protein
MRSITCFGVLISTLVLCAHAADKPPKDKPSTDNPATGKPLLTTHRGQSIDMWKIADPKDASGGQWLVRGTNILVDARKDPGGVTLPFPILPGGTYDFYVNLYSDDDKPEFSVEFPVGKHTQKIVLNDKQLMVNNAPRLGVKAESHHAMYLNVQLTPGKSPAMTVRVAGKIYKIELDDSAGSPDPSARIKLTARNARCAFQNFRVRVMD